MAYTKTNWKDRAVERPRTYRMQNNPDGTVTLIPMPGTVYEQGTPVNAPNLNKIEQGIADAVRREGDTMTGNLTTHKDVPRHIFRPTRDDIDSSSGHVFQTSNGTAKFVVGYDALNDHYAVYDYIARRNRLIIKSNGDILLDGQKVWTAGNFDPNSKLDKTGGNIDGELRILELLRLTVDITNNRVYLQGGRDQNDSNAEIRFTRRNAATGKLARFLVYTDQARINGYDIFTAENTPQTRLNNGVFEVNDGGWKPVGGIKRVQRGEVTTVSGTNPYNITISAVDMAKSFVTFNNTISLSGDTSSINVKARLTSSTNLQISMNQTVLGAGYSFSWEVIEGY